MLKKSIDINQAFRHFFDTTNWKVNSAIIGGALLFINALSYAFGFISALLDAQGDEYMFISMIVKYLATPFSMVVSIYFSGYSLELIRNTTEEGPMMDISVKDNVVERFKDGGRFFLGNLVYTIPMVIMGVIAAFGFVIPTMSDSDVMMPFTILGILMALVLIIVLIMYGIFVAPAIMINYANKGSFASMFEFSTIWDITKNNIINFLTVFGMQIIFSFVFTFALFVAGISIFLCVGIVLFPVVYAVGYTMMLHMQANLLGQVKVINDNR